MYNMTFRRENNVPPVDSRPCRTSELYNSTVTPTSADQHHEIHLSTHPWGASTTGGVIDG